MADTDQPGGGGSAEAWLDAAHAALVDRGVGAVKIMALARRLGVSRTSFYWHFADRAALLEALLARWRDKNTGTLIRRTRAPAATATEAVYNLFDCWVDPALFDARLDMAVRHWAQAAPALRATVAQADTARVAAIAAMFSAQGFEAAEAAARANTVYQTQVGYFAMGLAEPLDERLARMPHYAAIFTGRAPSADETARFLARHGDRA